MDCEYEVPGGVDTVHLKLLVAGPQGKGSALFSSGNTQGKGSKAVKQTRQRQRSGYLALAIAHGKGS